MIYTSKVIAAKLGGETRLTIRFLVHRDKGTGQVTLPSDATTYVVLTFAFSRIPIGAVFGFARLSVWIPAVAGMAKIDCS